jgi:hypothetical protein
MDNPMQIARVDKGLLPHKAVTADRASEGTESLNDPFL